MDGMKTMKGKGMGDLDMNPNPDHSAGPNGSPDGPHSHELGHTGDGGYTGKTSVPGQHGGTFYFR